MAFDSLQSLLFDATVGALAEVVKLVAAPQSRTFWPVLALSVAVAWMVSRRERGDALPPHLRVWSFETWFSRSAINDYFLIVVNGALFGVALAAWQPDGAALAARITERLQHAFPDFAARPSVFAPVLLAAALFVVDDFVRYATHWLEHRVPALWELHKVHHSAEVLNFLTAERQHPLSAWLFRGTSAVTAAAVNGVFLWKFGASVTPSSALGANVFWIATTMLVSTLRHSPVWVSFGPHLECWLLSPAQHQIHHSIDPRHHGRNLGGALAIWDRLFGTLQVTDRQRVALSFGLGEETAKLRSVRALYWRPIREAARVLASKSPPPA